MHYIDSYIFYLQELKKNEVVHRSLFKICMDELYNYCVDIPSSYSFISFYSCVICDYFDINGSIVETSHL